MTGGSRGIGRAISIEFARNGFFVGVNYLVDHEAAHSTLIEVKKYSDGMILKADVSKSSQVKKMFDEFGDVDVLINNAGIVMDSLILNMRDEDWLKVIDVNLNGSFYCLREAARRMKNGGSIVNISSIVGVRGSIGNANYAASKGGLIALTKSAAKELGRFNIKVNAVLPGFHLTRMALKAWGKYKDRIISEHTLGRLTDLSELAKFVYFIATQNSASGQVFNFESRVI